MDLLKENKQLKRQLEEADARRDDKVCGWVGEEGRGEERRRWFRFC